METENTKGQKKTPADEDKLKGREDKRSHNIDANLSIKEMREGVENDGERDNGPEDDAMNYRSDRENGAYNPKNI